MWIIAIPQDLSRVLLNLSNNVFYAVNEKKEKTQLVKSKDGMGTDFEIMLPL